jgi:site-specific DNA recombinase
VAALFKQLTFHGVTLLSIGEGEITELHVGLKGAVSALYFKDLAQKTRRRLEGRVREGRSAGGLSYGYRIARGSGAEPSTGERVIEPYEAGVVRGIFADFAAGKSPRAIAIELNHHFGAERQAVGRFDDLCQLAARHRHPQQRTPASLSGTANGS